ncbi:head completion/stabilization protein [Moraxella nasibovis]|uniref:head completion/stabilization protein n=1 Tax=Moraxella nasibovis TaxID=2904120 RepID=UPI0024109AB0|nr:head completion/stabilization protein [Moraxella nasibovis]WFF38044.1 head completion/stabilization protein [Moraxella nasibovis]
MSLIANGELSTALSQIDGGEFFPSVSVSEVRDFVRVDGSVTDFRLHQIILEETLDVMRLLDPLTKKAGRLTDLSTAVIDGRNAFEVWYFSAIANGVGAKVCEKYRNYDSTNKGSDKAAELSATIDEYRRNKMWAIAQMQGRNQTVVELI